jgi:hypothetical protein
MYVCMYYIYIYIYIYISRGGWSSYTGLLFSDPFLAVVAESWIAGSWAMCYGNPLLHGLISRGGGSGGLLFCTATHPDSPDISIMYDFCISNTCFVLRSVEELLLRRRSNSFAPQNPAVAEEWGAALLSTATNSSTA